MSGFLERLDPPFRGPTSCNVCLQTSARCINLVKLMKGQKSSHQMQPIDWASGNNNWNNNRYRILDRIHQLFYTCISQSWTRRYLIYANKLELNQTRSTTMKSFCLKYISLIWLGLGSVSEKTIPSTVVQYILKVSPFVCAHVCCQMCVNVFIILCVMSQNIIWRRPTIYIYMSIYTTYTKINQTYINKKATFWWGGQWLWDRNCLSLQSARAWRGSPWWKHGVTGSMKENRGYNIGPRENWLEQTKSLKKHMELGIFWSVSLSPSWSSVYINIINIWQICIYCIGKSAFWGSNHSSLTATCAKEIPCMFMVDVPCHVMFRGEWGALPEALGGMLASSGPLPLLTRNILRGSHGVCAGGANLCRKCSFAARVRRFKWIDS